MSDTELNWTKSSYSSSGSGDCVEVAVAIRPDVVHVRDSKMPRGPRLVVSADTWVSFLAGATRR
ncbi:DUF397 domain-containing protein [Streptomyces sp. MMBL 11-3]|uniref:DUF397 domain-containing protein n=1 Tax=Streptomyces sp. MMBL 11-3 TaxID=3382639 RepID=UPI0039B45B70